MENRSLDETLLHTLFAFAQDFVESDSEQGRVRADRAAYNFVDTIHHEDIYLREIYTEFYESEKKRWLKQKETNNKKA